MLLNKCTRCGDEGHVRFLNKEVLLCSSCLYIIVDEWKIKRDEINFLGQGREYCKVKECKYEVNHEGLHSWENKSPEPHEHLWVRRRDGSWCSICNKPRFGQDLSDEERKKLRDLRNKGK